MRKHTFEDKKFSAGDANSQAFRDNWNATFATNVPEPNRATSDLPLATPDNPADAVDKTE